MTDIFLKQSKKAEKLSIDEAIDLLKKILEQNEEDINRLDNGKNVKKCEELLISNTFLSGILEKMKKKRKVEDIYFHNI